MWTASAGLKAAQPHCYGAAVRIPPSASTGQEQLPARPGSGGSPDRSRSAESPCTSSKRPTVPRREVPLRHGAPPHHLRARLDRGPEVMGAVDNLSWWRELHRLLHPAARPLFDQRGHLDAWLRSNCATRAGGYPGDVGFRAVVVSGMVLAASTVAALGGHAPRADVNAYDLYSSYPNAQLFSGYFLRGVNQYGSATSTSGPQRTSLWFQPVGNGAFRQFNTMPYRDCHWDLLRWQPGKNGRLVYLETQADCCGPTRTSRSAVSRSCRRPGGGANAGQPRRFEHRLLR